MSITAAQAQALARPDSVNTSSTTGTATSATAIGDRFLKLLVTQMKNQDPLDPMQNSEVTSQLAQISTVTGIDKLNTSIDAMSKSITSAQTFQASGLVGHAILAPGNVLDLSAAGAVGAVDLKQAASIVNVNIINSSGLNVAHLALGAKPSGVAGFSWNGKDDNGNQLPAGPYGFSVQATHNGQAVENAQLAQTTVNSVTLGGTEVVVNTKTLGSVPMSGIKQIF